MTTTQKERKWRVGDKAIATFKCHDGSIYRERGTIQRIWGKIPYAVTFIDKDGPIRIPIGELQPLTKWERAK